MILDINLYVIEPLLPKLYGFGMLSSCLIKCMHLTLDNNSSLSILQFTIYMLMLSTLFGVYIYCFLLYLPFLQHRMLQRLIR